MYELLGIKLGAEAALIDDKVISSYLHFINLAAELQLKIVDYPEVPVYHAGMDGALAAKAKPLFVNYPELYVQDIADFLLFAVQHLPDTVKNCIKDRVNTSAAAADVHSLGSLDQQPKPSRQATPIVSQYARQSIFSGQLPTLPNVNRLASDQKLIY